MMTAGEEESREDPTCSKQVETAENKLIKPPKYGIIYLSTIPLYMNVSKIKEFFSEFGTVGRVYLQQGVSNADTEKNKKKKRNAASRYSEGWVEFERKSVAKKVALLLNNKQVSSRKKSKQYDSLWNIKYLPGFKWIHLHERLAFERANKLKNQRVELGVSKKKNTFFSANVGQIKKDKLVVNKEFADTNMEEIAPVNQTIKKKPKLQVSLLGT